MRPLIAIGVAGTVATACLAALVVYALLVPLHLSMPAPAIAASEITVPPAPPPALAVPSSAEEPAS